MHGNYRVLKTFNDVQVKNLVQVFDKNNADAFQNPTTACRNMCLSNLDCQFWQLLKMSGCWIEGEAGYNNIAHYPLVNEDLMQATAPEEVVAGEYIQHFCPSAIPGATPAHNGVSVTLAPTSTTTTSATTTTTTTTTSAVVKSLIPSKEESSSSAGSGASSDGSFASSGSDESFESSSGTDSGESSGSDSSDSWPAWAWTLLLLLLLCCLLALVGAIMFAMGLCDKKAPKKKRGKKTALPARPAPTAPVAAPVVTTPAPQPIYAAPPPQPVYTVQQQPVPVPTTMRSMPLYQPTQQYSQQQPLISPASVPMVNPVMQPMAQQYAARPMQGGNMFDMLDRNHDGVLTREEMRAAGILR